MVVACLRRGSFEREELTRVTDQLLGKIYSEEDSSEVSSWIVEYFDIV